MGTSKNSEFAQMPHKGTPIRYGQELPRAESSARRGKIFSSGQPKGYPTLKLRFAAPHMIDM
jgi:hypothetical protein